MNASRCDIARKKKGQTGHGKHEIKTENGENTKNLEGGAAAYKKRIIELLDTVPDDDIVCFRFIYTLLNRHVKSGRKWIIG